MTVTERADAARNRQAVLDAATRIFASAGDPALITMDDVAAAAGVGKGTLFRRFGDRAGLLQAVWETRAAELESAVTSGPPPLGPGTPAAERAVAILDAVVVLKLQNRPLSVAIERSDRTVSLYGAPQYVTTHRLLAAVLVEAVGRSRSSYVAHALLAVTRVDLIEHLLTTEGLTPRRVRNQVTSYAEHVLSAYV